MKSRMEMRLECLRLWDSREIGSEAPRFSEPQARVA